MPLLAPVIRTRLSACEGISAAVQVLLVTDSLMWFGCSARVEDCNCLCLTRSLSTAMQELGALCAIISPTNDAAALYRFGLRRLVCCWSAGSTYRSGRRRCAGSFADAGVPCRSPLCDWGLSDLRDCYFFGSCCCICSRRHIECADRDVSRGGDDDWGRFRRIDCNSCSDARVGHHLWVCPDLLGMAFVERATCGCCGKDSESVVRSVAAFGILSGSHGS